ncbi:DUF7344 domain-containing protein [Halobacterium litoreum]|uniref:DUF7344 domain-containing protein n=1 Tax=Halobacterium litoreum TaxID=2039234 RepID=A0ABD5NFJ5_9EURY|nr:hypothetical protein [Halobacterium litoreum]UHH13168.1 hypothetical protein LT972_13550 [Halobacterium litoreum]
MVNRDDTPAQSEAGPPRSDAAVDGPDPDDLFVALADATRRRVLWYLRAEDEVAVDDLVDVLAGWQLADTDVVDAADRERIAVSLHHVHLPRLANAGLVEWDAGNVSLADVPAGASELIRDAYEYDRAVAGVE